MPTTWCDRCPYPERWCFGTMFPDRCEAIVGGEPGGRTTVIHAETAGPGILRKAANFGKALVTHAVAGFPEADAGVAEQRLAICRDCDLHDAASGTCRHQGCGCVLDIKVTWADQKCPIGKW